MGFWVGPILDDIIALGGLDTRPKAGSGCCPIPSKKEKGQITILKCYLHRILAFYGNFMFFFNIRRGRGIKYRIKYYKKLPSSYSCFSSR
jgi:hypothetical protein